MSTYSKHFSGTLIAPDGTIRHFIDGALGHHEDQPSVEYPDGTRVHYTSNPKRGAIGQRASVEHRVNGPALIQRANGDQFFYHMGKLSRDPNDPYRSTGFKSHGGKDGPGRATGYKSHAAEGGASRGEGRSYTPREGKPAGDRPYGKPAGARPEGGKSWGSKSQGDKPYGAKSFGAKPAGKPARPAGDAKDTSKRFTPPKRPRG